MENEFDRQSEWLQGAVEMTPTFDELLPMPESQRRRRYEAFSRHQDDLQALIDALEDPLLDE